MPSLFYSQSSLQLPTNFPLSEGLALTFNLVVNRALSTSSPLVSTPARPAAHLPHRKTPPETWAFSRRCRAPQNTAKTAQDIRRQRQTRHHPPAGARPAPEGRRGRHCCRAATISCPASPRLARPGQPRGVSAPRTGLPAGSLWGEVGACLRAEARKKGELSPQPLTNSPVRKLRGVGARPAGSTPP